MKMYVGNLPWSVGDSELSDLFAEFGTVESASVVTDRESGRSRGFGFVEIVGTTFQEPKKLITTYLC